MKTLERLESDFEAYQSARLERCKRIGVPNLALEMAERKVQLHFYAEEGEVPSLRRLLETLVELGEARFSTANENRRDLFETTEEWIERVSRFILENWEMK